MLKLNTDEEKQMEFEISIEGIDHKTLNGRLKFIIEDVEYSFAANILSDSISVNIPPLDNIVKKGLINDQEVECKLEVYGENSYLAPWSGKFQLQTANKIHIENVIKQTPKPKKTLKRKITQLVEIVSNTGKTYKVTPSVARRIEELTGPTPIISKKPKKINEVKKTKINDPYQLMESVGMKSKAIQQVMIDKATEIGGDDSSSMISALESLLGITKTKQDTFKEMEAIHNKLRIAT